MQADNNGGTEAGNLAGFGPALPVDFVEDDEGLQALLNHLNISYTSPEQQVQQADPYNGLPLYALPDEQYLEASVLPLLLRGLEELATARPRDPLAFLGAYLITNNPQRRAVAPNLLLETWSESEKQAHVAANGGHNNGAASSSRPGSRKSRVDAGLTPPGTTAAAASASPTGGPSLGESACAVAEADWFDGTTRRRKVPLMECAYRAARQFDPGHLDASE